MAKARIIIFFLLIMYTFEQSSNEYSRICVSTKPSSDKYDCLERENDDYEDLGMHCCHRTDKYKSGNTNYECQFLIEGDNYEDIDGLIDKEKNDDPNYEDIKIDCFQKYISYNLVLLISFIFVIARCRRQKGGSIQTHSGIPSF